MTREPYHFGIGAIPEAAEAITVAEEAGPGMFNTMGLVFSALGVLFQGMYLWQVHRQMNPATGPK